MYELINNQLQVVKTIITPNQTAKVKTTIEEVRGYELDTPIQFGSIPLKEDNGMISELHYIDGELVWQYKPKPMTQEEYIQYLEDQVLLMADFSEGGIL